MSSTEVGPSECGAVTVHSDEEKVPDNGSEVSLCEAPSPPPAPLPPPPSEGASSREDQGKKDDKVLGRKCTVTEKKETEKKEAKEKETAALLVAPWPWHSYFDRMPTKAVSVLRRLRAAGAPMEAVDEVLDAIEDRSWRPGHRFGEAAAAHSALLAEFGRALA